MSDRININFRRSNRYREHDDDEVSNNKTNTKKKTKATKASDEKEKTYDYADFKFTRTKGHRDFQKKAAKLNETDLENNRIKNNKKAIKSFPFKNDGHQDRMEPPRYTYAEYDSGYNNKENMSSGGGGGNRSKTKKNKARRSKPRGVKRILLIILLALLLFIILFTGYIFFLKNSAPPVSFVMIGVDQREGQTDKEIRADAIMQVTSSMKHDEVIMASIPRDTYTYLPCTGQKDKITHSYIYGAVNWENQGGGPACTTKAVSDLTGLTTDKYMRINFADTVDIVNTIGGIDLTASATFCEQDSQGRRDEEHLKCFEQGKKYHMDGEQALAYARHRKTDNDIQRGLRQQEVFRQMFVSIKNKPFWEWPRLFIKLSRMLDTNLSMSELIRVGYSFMYDKDIEQYKFDWTGANYNGVSYVELSQESIDAYHDKVHELEK